MSVLSQIASDFAVFDGGQSITIKRYRAGSLVSGDPATVRNALPLPLTKQQKDALGGVALSGREMSWSLNAGDVGSTGIAADDLINDGTNNWRVLIAELTTLQTRWLCAVTYQP
jgi:hypothetical protein